MTLVLIFLGWLILSSLWGFLPVIEPLRQFALVASGRRKLTVFASGLLAFLTGLFLLLWVVSYSAAVITVYDAHAVSQSAAGQVQPSADVFSVANELALRQFAPGAGCLSQDATVCSLAAQALQFGNLANMLPLIGAAALIPGLLAAFVCWKLTPAPAAALPS